MYNTAGSIRDLCPVGVLSPVCKKDQRVDAEQFLRPFHRGRESWELHESDCNRVGILEEVRLRIGMERLWEDNKSLRQIRQMEGEWRHW